MFRLLGMVVIEFISRFQTLCFQVKCMSAGMGIYIRFNPRYLLFSWNELFSY